GEQTRDFVFVGNVVEANLRAVASETAVGRAINIGCGLAITVRELYGHLAEALGSSSAPSHGPDRPGDVRDSLASIDLARKTLGYEARVSFEEGLRRTCAWFREHPEAARRPA
ncbi:MAG TPA: GDP-mannose 4,6-dehydratase, partial [bacterium]|nr:GDP-mannose 4,6-dehydratase [bacterium]